MARETQPGALYQPRVWDGEGEGREVQKGGDICILMADSCRGLTENRKSLQRNYPSIKNNFKKECY